MQRRVGEWRALNQAQVAILEQAHRPGEALQTDGAWLTELGVTLQGELYKHLLIHCVLPYSNWEWGRLARTESLLAVRLGLQSTLFKLGFCRNITRPITPRRRPTNWARFRRPRWVPSAVTIRPIWRR